MTRRRSLKHEFVEFIPDHLAEGTLYISIEYATASHKCCCGCGKEVVTPLSPTDWRLIFDGKTISLEPSIGNWGFPCRSHYWITRGQVRWAGRMSQAQIRAGRAYDAQAKQRYFRAQGSDVPSTSLGRSNGDQPEEGWLRKLRIWLLGK